MIKSVNHIVIEFHAKLYQTSLVKINKIHLVFATLNVKYFDLVKCLIIKYFTLQASIKNLSENEVLVFHKGIGIRSSTTVLLHFIDFQPPLLLFHSNIICSGNQVDQVTFSTPSARTDLLLNRRHEQRYGIVETGTYNIQHLRTSVIIPNRCDKSLLARERP